MHAVFLCPKLSRYYLLGKTLKDFFKSFNIYIQIFNITMKNFTFIYF